MKDFGNREKEKNGMLPCVALGTQITTLGESERLNREGNVGVGGLIFFGGSLQYNYSLKQVFFNLESLDQQSVKRYECLCLLINKWK